MGERTLEEVRAKLSAQAEPSPARVTVRESLADRMARLRWRRPVDDGFPRGGGLAMVLTCVGLAFASLLGAGLTLS